MYAQHLDIRRVMKKKTPDIEEAEKRGEDRGFYWGLVMGLFAGVIAITLMSL